jgi:hypothetical protein
MTQTASWPAGYWRWSDWADALMRADAAGGWNDTAKDRETACAGTIPARAGKTAPGPEASGRGIIPERAGKPRRLAPTRLDHGCPIDRAIGRDHNRRHQD